ncbi:MAG: hypothetical protein ACYTKD_10880 [Planctomycetota bacterium]|jgi:hypothetical protein
MPVAATKARLTAPKRRLVELMQRVNFGRIERLAVRAGEPVFDPPPRVVREIKLGRESGPRPEMALGDFSLKGPVRQLLDGLARLGDGVVQSVEVKHGLPLVMRLEGTAGA